MTAVWWAVFYAVLVAVLLYLLVAAATYARLAFISNGEIAVKSGIMKNILRRPIKSFRGENDAFYLNLYTADMDIYRNDFLNVMPYLFSTVAAIVSSAALLFSMNIWLLVGALVVSGLHPSFCGRRLLCNRGRKRQWQVHADEAAFEIF